jgi:RNA polymerase sigma-70 factor (family 1)
MFYESLHISELQHRIAAFEDQLAYKDLFRRFQPLLKQFAYSICHSREGAEEIVSDVFIRVWAKRKTLDHIQNLRLYLYIATRNVSLNYSRAEQKFQTLQLDALKVDIEAVASDPQQMLVNTELKQRIQYLVNELPTQCKIIFKLVKEDGLKQKEVAELLHLQPKTVENQLAIAVKKIGNAISEELNIKARK